MTPTQEEGFEAFVAAQADGLLRYARLLVGSPHDAEDALQTALVRLARHWPLDAPTAYARTALRNLAVDRARRRHLVPTPSTDEPVLPPVPDLAEAVAAQQALDELLGALPPRQRLTVVLRTLDGLSEAETAAVLQCAPGTVRSNLSRGLAALRDALQPERSTP